MLEFDSALLYCVIMNGGDIFTKHLGENVHGVLTLQHNDTQKLKGFEKGSPL